MSICGVSNVQNFENVKTLFLEGNDMPRSNLGLS